MKNYLIRLTCMCLMLTAINHAGAYDYERLVRADYSTKADSVTKVFIDRFLVKSYGYFKETPSRVGEFIYWQQAHAMDVVIYSYLRIKDDNPTLANTYATYMERWYENHANNYHHDENDVTGFSNPFTDDMCWIGLTLTHISDALGDDKYFDTARTLYDRYIITRGWTDGNGYFGLPWNTDDRGRNACTNGPGCLLATLLYQKYGKEKYLQDALKLYDFMENVQMPRNEAGNLDYRVEEPPLTYTQGTFAEACRQLFHITGEEKYAIMGARVMNYAFTSERCTQKTSLNGKDVRILRHEGTSMDQSIFKAVLIPYAVNMALDDDLEVSTVVKSCRISLINNLQNNADVLWMNLDHNAYPRTMYCNYYWGEPYTGNANEASMGAMASGASLMEGVARLCNALRTPTGIILDEGLRMKDESNNPSSVYDLQGRKVADNPSFLIPHLSSKPGIYIVNGRKIVIR